MSTDFASSSAFFFVTVTCKQWRRCSRDQTFKLSFQFNRQRLFLFGFGIRSLQSEIKMAKDP